MNKTLPEVRIKYAALLSGVASTVMNEKYGGGEPLRSYERYEAIARQYEAWWRPVNDRILSALCEVLELRFRQNIIDVNVAPWFTPISDPMVIGPGFKSADELINTITHELIHRLLTDNTARDHNYDVLSDWRRMFGDEHEWNTLVHIPVHATLEKVYADIISRPDLVEFDIKYTQANKPYADAWHYVKRVGYDEIIKQLVSSHKAA